MKDLKLDISDHVSFLKTKIRILFKYWNVEIKAALKYDEEKKVLEVGVLDATLPIPLFKKSIDLAMFIIKLAVRKTKNISVKKNKIFIKFVEGES